MDGPPDDRGRAPRQRWRLIARRSAAVAGQTQRELSSSWEAALAQSGLPVATSDATPPRVRVAFGAPLPVGVVAERELIDIFLTDRLPVWRVREAIHACAPSGWELVDLFDVWLAGPALPGQVVAAEYRIELEHDPSHGLDPDPTLVAAAAGRLLAARALPRDRAKSGGTVRYDLRPLVDAVTVTEPGPPVVVRARTRFDPELGTGRPDEVLAALAAEAGSELRARTIVRERLLVAGDPDGRSA